MGKLGFTSSLTGSRTTVGGENRSMLESAGTAVFDLLDWPANMFRSGVAYAQTGDTSYLENIEDVINPFKTSRRVRAEEITGSDGLVQNLAVDILLDPLLPVSSVLQPTKAVKAFTAVKSVRQELALATKLAKYTKAAEDAEAVTKLTERLVKLEAEAAKVIKPGSSRRTLATVGVPFTQKFDIDIPLPRKLERLARNVQLLPDARIPDLQKRLKSLGKAEKKAAARVAAAVGDDAAQTAAVKHDKIVKAIERTSRRLEGADTGILGSIISPETANMWRARGKKLRGAFAHTAEKKEIETLRNLTQINIARDLFDLKNKDRALLANRLDSLKELGHKFIDESGKPLGRAFTPEEVSTRLLRGAEADFIFDQKIPDVDKLLQEDVAKATEGLIKKHGDPKTLTPEKRQEFEEALHSKVFGAKKQAESRKLRLAEAHKIVGNLMPEEIDVIRTVREHLDQMVPLENSLSLGTEQLQTSRGLLSYFPRVYSPEMRALKDKDLKKYGILTRDFQTRLAAANKRTLYPESELGEINKLLREDYGLPFDVFDTNVVRAVTERKVQHITNIHKAAAINVATELFQQKRKTFGGEKIAKVWKKLGLDPERAPKGFLPGSATRDLLNVNQLFVKAMDPEGVLAKGFHTLDKINGVWRTALTIPFPSFHHRNFLNNVAMSHLTGNVRAHHYTDMLGLMRKAARGNLTEKEQKLWKEFHAMGMDNVQVEDYAQFLKGSKVEQILERPVKGTMDVILQRLGKGTAERSASELDALNLPMGKAYGRFVEQLSRGAHILGEMQAGKSPVQVLESVNKFLFDPKKLTNFERGYVKPMFMFYSWLRNNLPLMFKTLFTHPRYANLYGKITGLGDEEAPPYLKGTFAFKAPEGIFGPNQFVGSLGLGLEDLFLLSVARANPSGNPIASAEQVGQLANNVLRQLGPTLKVPAEILAGKNFFTGRKMEDMDPIEYAKTVLPTSRATSEVSKLLDSNRTIASRAIDLLTGMRVYTVDPKKVKIANAKRAALRTGRVKEFPVLISTTKGDPEAKKILKQVRKTIKENR